MKRVIASMPVNAPTFRVRVVNSRGTSSRNEAYGVKVEETKLGDHYDPEAKALRLSPENFNGRSLTAVVIAAHEAGHAMQDATGYPPLAARTRLAKQAIRLEKVAAVVMLAARSSWCSQSHRMCC